MPRKINDASDAPAAEIFLVAGNRNMTTATRGSSPGATSPLIASMRSNSGSGVWRSGHVLFFDISAGSGVMEMGSPKGYRKR